MCVYFVMGRKVQERERENERTRERERGREKKVYRRQCFFSLDFVSFLSLKLLSISWISHFEWIGTSSTGEMTQFKQFHFHSKCKICLRENELNERKKRKQRAHNARETQPSLSKWWIVICLENVITNSLNRSRIILFYD